MRRSRNATIDSRSRDIADAADTLALLGFVAEIRFQPEVLEVMKEHAPALYEKYRLTNPTSDGQEDN